MSQSSSQESRPPSGGVMRRLAAGAKGGGFANAFQLVDALFSPSKTAAYVEKQEAKRRRVAVPSPGDPPSHVEDEVLDGPAPDDPAALPADLLGPVVDEPPDAPRQVPAWGTPGGRSWGSPDAPSVTPSVSAPGPGSVPSSAPGERDGPALE